MRKTTGAEISPAAEATVESLFPSSAIFGRARTKLAPRMRRHSNRLIVPDVRLWYQSNEAAIKTAKEVTPSPAKKLKTRSDGENIKVDPITNDDMNTKVRIIFRYSQ
jgi:hypothetical protein